MNDGWGCPCELQRAAVRRQPHHGRGGAYSYLAFYRDLFLSHLYQSEMRMLYLCGGTSGDTSDWQCGQHTSFQALGEGCMVTVDARALAAHKHDCSIGVVAVH
jgi:hypothetical protein